MTPETSINVPSPITWPEALNLSPRELEILIRQRLGQKDAVFKRATIPHNLDKPEHKRFDFDSGTNYYQGFTGIMNNMEILRLFEDLIPIPTFIATHKGSIWVSIQNKHCDLNTYDFSGYSTIDVITALIKRDFPNELKIS